MGAQKRRQIRVDAEWRRRSPAFTAAPGLMRHRLPEIRQRAAGPVLFDTRHPSCHLHPRRDPGRIDAAVRKAFSAGGIAGRGVPAEMGYGRPILNTTDRR
jgi:transposase